MRRFSFNGAALGIFALITVARGDTTATWDGAVANWTDAAHWGGGVFPNNGGVLYDAVINGGRVTLDQDISINELLLAGGTLDGAFSLGAAEGLQWTGGAIQGSGLLTLGSAGVTTITGGAIPLELTARVINNAGALVFGAGTIRGGGGAQIKNQLGATALVFAGANFFALVAAPAYTIENAGTFTARSTSGSGFTTIDAAFHNSGLLRVENAGIRHTLSLAGGGIHSGAADLQAGAFLELGNNTTLAGGASFAGDGVVVVAGSVSLNGSVSGRNLTVAVGELDLGSFTFDLSGMATQTGGITRIDGGTARIAAGLGTWILDDGSITGVGTLDARLDSQGNVAPGLGIGTLNITGATTFGIDARLTLEIGGASAGSFDHLTISSTASLGGALHITLASGFMPANGDNFMVLLATGGLSGVFANAPVDGGRFVTADGLGSFAIDYTATSVVLSQFIPEPSVALLGTLGASFLGFTRRRRFPSGSASKPVNGAG